MHKLKSGIAIMVVVSILAMLLPALPVAAAGLGAPVIKVTYIGSATKNAQGEYEIEKGETVPVRVSVANINAFAAAQLYVFNTADTLQRDNSSLIWNFEPGGTYFEDIEKNTNKRHYLDTLPYVIKLTASLKDMKNPQANHAANEFYIAEYNYTVTGEPGEDCHIYIPNSLYDNPSGLSSVPLPDPAPWNFFPALNRDDGYSSPYDTGNWAKGLYEIFEIKDVGTAFCDVYGSTIGMNATQDAVTYDLPKFKIVENAEKTLSGIAIKDTPQTQYFVGQELDLSTGSIEATYSDDSTETILLSNLPANSVTGFNSNAAVTGQELTVSYTVGDVTQTCTYTVDIKAPSRTGIVVNNPKRKYHVKERFDPTVGTVSIVYDYGTPETKMLSECSITGFNSALPATGLTINVSYEDMNTSYTIDVLEGQAVYVTVNGSQGADMKVDSSVTIGAVPSDFFDGLYTYQYGYKPYSRLTDATNYTAATSETSHEFDLSHESPGKYIAIVKASRNGINTTVAQVFTIERTMVQGRVLVNGYGIESVYAGQNQYVQAFPYYNNINISYVGAQDGEEYSFDIKKYDYSDALVPSEPFTQATSKDFSLTSGDCGTYMAVVYVQDESGKVTPVTRKYFVVSSTDLTGYIQVAEPSLGDYGYCPYVTIGTDLSVQAVLNKNTSEISYLFKLVPWDQADSVQPEAGDIFKKNASQSISTNGLSVGRYQVVMFAKYADSTAEVGYDLKIKGSYIGVNN